MGILVTEIATQSPIYFTNREKEVIACLMHGRGSKSIARILQISPHTVLTHIKNLKQKMGCHFKQDIISHIENNRITWEELRYIYASLQKI